MSRAAVFALLLPYTVLPTIVMPCCGGFASSEPLFGAIPTRLSREIEFTTNRFPPALVPEYPMPFLSEIEFGAEVDDVVEERRLGALVATASARGGNEGAGDDKERREPHSSRRGTEPRRSCEAYLIGR